jgi:hypothetical protein
MENKMDFNKIFEEKGITSSFLIFGGAGLLLSIFNGSILGLRISVLTLFFGGLFRILGIIEKAPFLSDDKDDTEKNHFDNKKRLIRFFIWFIFLMVYIILVFNKILV